MDYGLTPLVPLSRCERGMTSNATSILELSPSHLGGGVWGEVDWVRSKKRNKCIYELIRLHAFGWNIITSQTILLIIRKKYFLIMKFINFI